MKLLKLTVLFSCCIISSLVSAQNSNIFLKRDFWKTNPTIEIVEQKIKENNNATALNSNGFDAVTYAILAKAPNATIKHLLLKKGNAINKLTHDKRTYVFWAAYKGNIELVKHLINNNARLDLRDSHHFSPLTFAAVAGQTIKEFFQPFLSEAMLTEALTDISLRGGKTSTGSDVYNPEDHAFTKGGKMIMHVVDTMIPGFVPVNISGGVPESSRFLRGTLGTEEGFLSYKDKMGRERTFVGEMARAMSGVTPLEFDPKKGLEYGGFRMQRSQTDAKRMFNRVVEWVLKGAFMVVKSFL